MRIKYRPEDFRVEELIDLILRKGAHAYYKIEKRGVPTTVVRDELAAKLKLSPSAVVFPALKDSRAVAVQYASVRSRKAPEIIKGERFSATRVGRGSRALEPANLKGNRFSIVVRDLAPEEAAAFPHVMEQIAASGLPNYFDDQRFGSLSDKGFIGQAVLQRDAELAVRIYLSEPMLGDPKNVLEFKELVRTHWGQWGFLLHEAPRPSNFRSVITYLKDHPHEFRKAVNLIQDRLLSIYLSAYQSWVWNRIVGRYLSDTAKCSTALEIAAQHFPLPDTESGNDDWFGLSVPLPRLTAYYQKPLDAAVEAVLAEDGLTLPDFKARILKRVYVPKGERLVGFTPYEVSCDSSADDKFNAGRKAVTVHFTLSRGCYATIVLKALASRLGTQLRVR
ncbi:MAG: tRNA pseudouridine(13) synthase TruD [Anaerolineae bacterium]|nr:tRNA pseudouridine(13) synthase TruD [Anaerolineae bacterium]